MYHQNLYHGVTSSCHQGMYRGVTGSPVVTRNCIAMSPDYMYRVTTAVHNYRGVHIEAPMLYTDST